MLFILVCKEFSFDVRMPLVESVYVARLAGSLSAIPEEIVTVPNPPVCVESTAMVSPLSARPEFDVSWLPAPLAMRPLMRPATSTPELSEVPSALKPT